MKVEEKSKQLIDKFLPLVRGGDLYDTYYSKAIQCALICVEQIKEGLEDYEKSSDVNDMDCEFIYWNKVKNHLLEL